MFEDRIFEIAVIALGTVSTALNRLVDLLDLSRAACSLTP